MFFQPYGYSDWDTSTRQQEFNKHIKKQYDLACADAERFNAKLIELVETLEPFLDHRAVETFELIMERLEMPAEDFIEMYIYDE